MEFLDSLHQVKQNWGPYKTWEKEQNDKEAQRQMLHSKINTNKEELNNASEYGRTIIDNINIMDQYSINKAEDVEGITKPLVVAGIETCLGVGALAGFGLLKTFGLKALEKSPKKAAALYIGIPAAIGYLGSTIAGFITQKHYEKQASRIARYQAREKELKDSRNFVVYTKDQVEKAKKLTKEMPEIKDKNKKENSLNPITNISNSMKSIKTLKADSANYDEWKKEFIEKETNRHKTLDSINATPEQIEQATKDRDNLQNVVKKIELNSQNYLFNTEMALNSVMACDLLGGALGGAIVSGGIWLLQKIKVLKPDSVKLQLAKALSPIIAPMALIIATAAYSIQIQKEAARVGRFKAKQDLLKDPHNFISYNDEQMQTVKDIKTPEEKSKGFFGKLKDEVKFFFQFGKDYKDYKNYEKTTEKEELKLREALKKVSITPEQAAEAKKLQKNAFYTFEKMDEMAQRYSDDTAAATDIVKSIAAIITTFGAQALGTFLVLKTISKEKSSHSKIALEAIIPMIASSAINIPLEIQSIRIKKEASKIGLMKAMQDINDPKLFINNDNIQNDETKKA